MAKDAKGVALILGRLAQPKDEGGEEGGDAYSAAAGEVFSAIEAKDSEALGQALKSFVQMCMTEE